MSGTGWRHGWLALATSLAVVTAAAQEQTPPDGEKAVIAVTRDGRNAVIGSVRFSPLDTARSRFQLRMDPAALQDHFLSMREFKCLPAAQEITCYVPYPYRHPGTVTATDFAWLEHSLLFFFKQPTDYGAKLWNGIIFRFEVRQGVLVGIPQAVDLNRIGVPPDDLDTPPYGPMDRDSFAPGARWVRELRIE